MTWFKKLSQPTVFFASPGDVAGIRQRLLRDFDLLKWSVADHYNIQPYSWEMEMEASSTGFNAWQPIQAQIALPDYPFCRAVVLVIGERIGSPLDRSYPFEQEIDEKVKASKDGDHLVIEWEKSTDNTDFPLTGTVFEYLSAIKANKQRLAEDRTPIPVLVLVCNKESLLDSLENYFSHDDYPLTQKAKEKLQSEDAYQQWKESEYIPQVSQLRNFLNYIRRNKGIQLKFISNEEEASKLS
ncbi:MAG: hypothetical protein WCF67_02750, partial [Chitinophagaceae bacterium]